MKKDIHKVYTLAQGYVTAKVVLLAGEYELDKLITTDGIKTLKLAQYLNLNEEALKRFLRVLEAHEIISIVDGSVYRTELTEQLARVRTPHLMKAYQAFDELEYMLKTHQPAWNKKFGQDFYSTLNQGELNQFSDWCRQSGHAWLGRLFELYNFSAYQRIVDVAGAQGHLLGSLLKLHPHQTGILFDLPLVVQKADMTLSNYDCLDRVGVVGGDFFQAVPEDGELYILCRTLLNWSDKDAIKILNVCARCMPQNAKLLIIDFMLPPKSDPHYLRAVLNDLNLMANWNSLTRTKQEWLNLVDKSQLKVCKAVVSDSSLMPELFAPMILVECQNK
jgi:hypothetical protein